MGVQNRLNWEAKGSPFRLMSPAADLMRTLRGYGYTVYALGDKSHLEADPPEDHTPYSATGYPGRAVYGVGYAIDIMPAGSGSGLPSLQQLGAQLLADRKAGLDGIAWLKYMNWEPGGGPCWHESWQPGYRRGSSTDRGHIHLSGLTGLETSTIGAGYDPVARIRGDDMPLSPAEGGALTVAYQDGASWINGWDTTPGGGPPHWGVRQLKALATQVDALAGNVQALANRPAGVEPIDYDKLAAALLRQIASTKS